MAIHLHPEPMTREQWMDAAREGYTIVSFAFESMDIEVSGDTGDRPRALLAGRQLPAREPVQRRSGSPTSGRAPTALGA